MNQPMREDEYALWAKVLEGEKPRYAGFDLGIPPNRIIYLCTKWSMKRIYDWGVAVDMGWPVKNLLGDLAPNAVVYTQPKEKREQRDT